MVATNTKPYILPTIIVAQFFCTSLWFAGNAVLPDLIKSNAMEESSVSGLTTAVQLGFIIGTLLFAVLSIADRLSPSKVFFVSAIFGAIINLILLQNGLSFGVLMACRFGVGLGLAGIYPVGMKIASDYFEKGLGLSLGFLVGALVLGTALPHLIRSVAAWGALPWKTVIFTTSALAALGGLAMVLLVPDGPYRKKSTQFFLGSFFDVFKNRKFRAAAVGYFGHMWELYAFWAFVPIMLQHRNAMVQSASVYSFVAFLVIGAGSISCVLAGYTAKRLGAGTTAYVSLGLSTICCLLSPLFLSFAAFVPLCLFLLFWGMVVIADSPMFSTLVAQRAPIQIKGTALTIVNSVGFSITILSIHLMDYFYTLYAHSSVFMLLSIGPILGLVFVKQK